MNILIVRFFSDGHTSWKHVLKRFNIEKENIEFDLKQSFNLWK